MNQLSSKSNDRVKRLTKLVRDASFRRETSFFVAEGERLCLEALKAGCVPTEFYVTRKALEKYPEAAEALELASSLSFVIDDKIADAVSDTTGPQGVFCLCRIPEPRVASIEPGGRYVALDRVQNPQNLGSVVRTAEAFGLDAVIVSGGCDLYNPKALRASMGSILRFPVISADDLVTQLEMMKKMGIKAYASVPDRDATPVYDIDRLGGAVAVIGNEGSGIDDAVIACCDERFTIPMKGVTESLNASAAASVIMWEFSK